jgi:hypothetical protein
MALITVLSLSSLLLLLGLTFLSFIETDYHFSAQQDRRQQVLYLAQAGLEYQRSRTDLLAPQPGAARSMTRFLPESSPTHGFEITVESNGTVISRGFIRNGFRELASLRLILDPGQPVANARAAP